jgi:hypothetical protein
MKVRTEATITVEMCRANPDEIFVFGDNLKGAGKRKGAGQAEIRDEPNAFGIPTKREPTTKDDAYFTDQPDEIEAVKARLRELYKLAKTKRIVFPAAGIGTGRAKMATKSPKAWAEMTRILSDFFEFENGQKVKGAQKLKP